MTWLLLNLSLQIQFSFANLCVLLSISPIAGRLYPLIARIWRCQAEMHLFSNEPSCFTSKTCVVTVRIEAAVSGLLRTTEPHERRYGYGQLILLSFLETRLAISNFSWWSLSQFFSCMFIRPRGHWVRNLDQIVIISKLNGYFLKASEQIGSSAIFLWGTLVWSHVSAILRRTPIKAKSDPRTSFVPLFLGQVRSACYHALVSWWKPTPTTNVCLLVDFLQVQA